MYYHFSYFATHNTPEDGYGFTFADQIFDWGTKITPSSLAEIRKFLILVHNKNHHPPIENCTILNWNQMDSDK